MYGQHFQQSLDQPGMVFNPARDQLSLFAPENLIPRNGFGCRVPREGAHSPHSG